MLKISRIRPCEYNKSCSIFHNESNKIEFAFFWIFYDFIENLQDSSNWEYYWSFNFADRPLEVSDSYKSFALRPSGRFGTSQCGLRAPVDGGPAKFRRTGGRDRPGAGGERPSGPWGSIPVLGWGRERAGEGAHRRPAAVAAATAVPAMGARCRGLGTVGEL
jgi:hypothetical protein